MTRRAAVANRARTVGRMTVRGYGANRAGNGCRMVIGLSGVAALVLAMPTPTTAAIDHAARDGTAIGARITRVAAIVADADEILDFAIAAQPLDEALAAYGTISGVQLIYDSHATRRLRATPITGRYDRVEALRQLLAGTGLVPQFTAQRSATLVGVVAEADPAGIHDGAVVLDALEVTSETAIGPTHGYVARRSATATKTGTSILETPQAVNVIGRKEIEDRQAQSVSQALLYTPGVLTQYGTDVRYDWLYVRGFVPGVTSTGCACRSVPVDTRSRASNPTAWSASNC